MGSFNCFCGLSFSSSLTSKRNQMNCQGKMAVCQGNLNQLKCGNSVKHHSHSGCHGNPVKHLSHSDCRDNPVKYHLHIGCHGKK